MNSEIISMPISRSSPLHFSYKQGVINPINRITMEEFESGKKLITDSDILYIIDDYKSNDSEVTPAFFIGDGKTTFDNVRISFWMSTADLIKSEKCIGYAGVAEEDLYNNPLTNKIHVYDVSVNDIIEIVPTTGMMANSNGRLFIWNNGEWIYVNGSSNNHINGGTDVIFHNGYMEFIDLGEESSVS